MQAVDSGVSRGRHPQIAHSRGAHGVPQPRHHGHLGWIIPCSGALSCVLSGAELRLWPLSPKASGIHSCRRSLAGGAADHPQLGGGGARELRAGSSAIARASCHPLATGKCSPPGSVSDWRQLLVRRKNLTLVQVRRSGRSASNTSSVPAERWGGRRAPGAALTRAQLPRCHGSRGC